MPENGGNRSALDLTKTEVYVKIHAEVNTKVNTLCNAKVEAVVNRMDTR